MTLVTIITLLIPLLTMSGAQSEYHLTRTVPASHLDAIYDSCQSTTINKFCFGGKANETAFPEGHGCLKDRDCDVLIHAIRGEKNSSDGHVDWQLCVQQVRAVGALFVISKEQVQDSNGSLRNIAAAVYNDGKESWTSASTGDLEPINATDVFENILAIKEMVNVTTTPPVACVMFTSPVVMKFPGGLEIDLVNDTITPFIYGGRDDQPFDYQLSPTLIFSLK